MEKSIEVFFCINMCAFDVDLVPDNGAVSIPANPGNSWYLICGNSNLAKILEKEIGAKRIDEVEDKDMMYLVDNDDEKETDVTELKDKLLQVFSGVIFLNEPPWIF